MICKSCGTECRGAYCSHCGAPLVNEAFSNTPAQNSLADNVKAEESTPTVTAVASTAPVSVEKAPSGVGKTRKRREKKQKQIGPKIKMRQIFFPSLMLLLPLFYLFLDVFVCYSDALYVQQNGVGALSGFIAQLASTEFAANPVSDLLVANFTGNAALFDTLTVKDILSAADIYRPFVLPAVLLAVFSLLSAICGVVTLFSGGKVLRVRVFADAVVTCGLLGALAPLLAGIFFRLSHAASGGFAGADAAMRLFGYSIEVILLCGISLALMLPAVRSLRRAAAGQGIYLTAPYRLLGKSIGLTRFFGVVSALLAIGLSLLALTVEIALGITLLDACFDALENVDANVTALLGALGSDDIILPVQGLYGLVLLTLLSIVAFSTLRAVMATLRILLARSTKIATKKRRRKALKQTGSALRGNATVLLTLYVVFYVLAVLVLLAMGVKAHVDIALVSDTLTVLYLLIAHVKFCAPLYTASVLFAALSLLFGTVAENFAKAFIVKSLQDHQN
ncbi:MAG: zinc ribbon domain-containing protein [Clostridia bacterium]|nr:zinc ribbon domain-containing protein [Clostridia bacterium]